MKDHKNYHTTITQQKELYLKMIEAAVGAGYLFGESQKPILMESFTKTAQDIMDKFFEVSDRGVITLKSYHETNS